MEEGVAGGGVHMRTKKFLMNSVKTKKPEDQIAKQAGICPPLNWQQYKQVTDLSCSNQLFARVRWFCISWYQPDQYSSLTKF